MSVRTLALLIITIPSLAFSASSSRILIFGKTIRPAHVQIIPVAGNALAQFFTKNGYEAEFTQETKFFDEQTLKSFVAIIFLDTSEGILNLEQKKSLEDYFNRGGGLLAIHASIALGNDWPWFRTLIGTSFKDHPPIQVGRIMTSSQAWNQNDEWYNFTVPLDSWCKVQATVKVAGTLHESSWSKESSTHSRFWYTAMGHDGSLYTDSTSPLLKHILQGLRWVTHE
jgi:cytochrome c